MTKPENQLVPSDVTILDLLRKRESLSVAELAELMKVTATAVRQRLNRLMGQGYVDRDAIVSGRGRPSHRYSLTARGKRKTGANFGDLAIALWSEIRAVKDPEVRVGLIRRISKKLAGMYADRLHGDSIEEKMESLVKMFAERDIPFAVESSGSLPVLNALACPYPELAEQDRSICAMEKMMFSDLLGSNVKLTRCRLDGESCCSFEPSQS